MSVDVGTQTQYDDPVSVNNPEILAFAADIQLGAYEGAIYNSLSAPEKAINLDTFKVGQRSRTALTGVIGDGAATGWVDGTDTTDLPMSEAQIAILTVGMILQVASEVVVVKSIDRSAFTIDVYERGAGSTTGAAHADQVAFTVIGHAINDTDAANVEAIKEQTGDYENYCQLVFAPIEQTFTDRTDARKYMDQNPQLQKEALDRIFRMLCMTTVRGVKRQGTNSIPATTAGILDQLNDTSSGTRTPLQYNCNGAFTETKLKAALDTAFRYGKPNAIYCSPTNKKIIDPLTQGFITMDRVTAQIAGTDNARAYEYQGQQLEIVQDSAYPDDRVSLVTKELIHKGWKANDTLKFVEEPPTSSRQVRFSYNGKWFVVVRGVGRDHVDMYGITA